MSTHNQEIHSSTPASNIHIGSDASHVTVHIHHHYHNANTSNLDSDTSVNRTSERTSETTRPSRPFRFRSPTTPTPIYNERRQSSDIPLRSTISSALSALPEGILSPTLQSVIQQVLQRQHSSAHVQPEQPRQHSPIRTSERQEQQDTPVTTNQREHNVAISFMMQPLAGRSVSLTDLFQQLTQDGNDPTSNNAMSIAELNHHTTIETYNSQNSLHDTCAVCREPFNSGQPVRRIVRCGHVFHTTCMDRWLESHSTCPLCMQTIVPPENDNPDNNDSNIESPSVHREHTTQNRTSSPPLEQSTLPTNPLTNVNNSTVIEQVHVRRPPDDELLNLAMDELTFDNDEDEDEDDSREHFV